VGWSLSRSLSIEGALEALRIALKANRGDMEGLIHHSDRGDCSHDYVKLLQKNGIKISMTEANHCYENGLSERVNGILKDEFLLDTTFNNFAQACSTCAGAIKTSTTCVRTSRWDCKRPLRYTKGRQHDAGNEKDKNGRKLKKKSMFFYLIIMYRNVCQLFS
jgi:transposase InsO family protein